MSHLYTFEMPSFHTDPNTHSISILDDRLMRRYVASLHLYGTVTTNRILTHTVAYDLRVDLHDANDPNEFKGKQQKRKIKGFRGRC